MATPMGRVVTSIDRLDDFWNVKVKRYDLSALFPTASHRF